MDTDSDSMVSAEEEKRAIEILERAKQQRMKDVQGTFLSYMNAYQNV